MERPWLILCRVLHVDPLGDDDDDLHADAEEHAAVGEAEADAEEHAHAAVAEVEAEAQAQEEQHAGVGEAEEHVAAVDVAAEAQAQHAAVAEAEEDAQAAQEEELAAVVQAQAEQEDAQAQEEQNVVAAVDAAMEAQDDQQAAVEEAEAEEEDEEDPQAQLEESVVNVNTDAAASEAAHAAHGAGEPDFTISVAPPPWVSYLIAGPGSHPDPGRPDMYPYIIATGRFCLLVHIGVEPSYGTNFGQEPENSHLVVARHFRRADGQIAACAVHVPERPDDDADMPALSNIESVGLVCDQETGQYQIAELIVTTAAPEAAVVYIRTDTGVWQGNYFVNPLGANCLRDWVPHGTVTVNSTVLWYDLSWGIISCDLAQPHLVQFLNFHRLPRGRILRAGAGAMPDLHCRRCIAVSENLVRYVEIILSPHQAATVNMWYRDVEDNPWRWVTNYSESFEDIWDDESYAQTGLPRNPPMLVGVSPVDSNVVYFSLDQRLFGVNVPEHTVVHCEEYESLNRPGPPDEPVTSRYLITWNLDLDEDGEINVGHHHPDEYSDHGDSSDSGPMDEGEIDYETPSE